MQVETEELFVQQCRTLIENQLGWGSSEEWTNQDYETLSEKIRTKTGVSLSIVTLKRIWGKVKYDSKPTITTLNALVQFVGYENWRSFRQNYSDSNGSNHDVVIEEQVDFRDKRNKRNKILFAGIIFLALLSSLGWYLFELKKEASKPDPTKFKFSSKKVVSDGVPNSVIFDYDAVAAAPSDTIYIQQSWDKRLRTQVPRDEHVHNSIYYYPGFFQAKLIVNNTVVKEHNLVINSVGWLPVVEQDPVPVYFNENEVRINGALTLTEEKMKENNINLQPSTPFSAFYYVKEFEGVESNNFKFETEIRNDYKEGSAVCQFTEVHVRFVGGALIIPLSVKGCVSELNLAGLDPDKIDIEALGCDFSKWVHIACVVKNGKGEVQIDHKKAFEFDFIHTSVKIIGVAYRFQGTGSVNYVTLSNDDGPVFDEQF